MTISDALPVQFWQTGCNTYNETVPGGVHEKCFCTPWQCDDEIKVQFQIDDTSPETIYALLIRDDDDNFLSSVDFTNTDVNLQSAIFSPETEGICDKQIQLTIVKSEGEDEQLSNASFVTTLDPWVDDGESWAWDSPDAAQAAVINGLEPTSNLTQDISPDSPEGWYRIEYHCANDPSLTSSLIAEVYKDGVLVKEILNETQPANTDINDDFISYAYIPSSFDQIKIRAEYATGPAQFTIYDFSLKSVTDLAKSDCLDVRLSHEDDHPTQLIEYSNARNFAGLVYSDISPDASFNIRVPCRFFHEVFPEEDEAIELTSSVINTAGQLKSQKLLEVAHVPYYFHKKLQLILKHQTLSIGGVNYQKEEKYEIIEGNKRWPLKPATCLLTEKNSVLRNVI